MIGGLGRVLRRSKVSVPAMAAGACALLVAASGLAEESRPLADPPPAAPAASPPTPQPGFIDAFSRWLEEGAARFKTNKPGTQAIPARNPRGASRRRRRAVHQTFVHRAAAQNSASDTQTAAATLCRGKGFQTGKILDTQTEQKCSSGRFLLEGRAPSSSECPTLIFVTRAMCQ